MGAVHNSPIDIPPPHTQARTGYKKDTMTNIKSSYPNITERDLVTFEQTFAVTLPIMYKNFLLEHNGGVPDNIFFINDAVDIVLNEFLPLKNSNLSIESYLTDFHFNLQHFVPVAEDAFGNLLLIDCKSDNGAIYFWNHEIASITYVTNSFEYFITNMQQEGD